MLSHRTGFYTRGQRGVAPEPFSGFLFSLPWLFGRSPSGGLSLNKKEPLLRGLDDHRVLAELGEDILDAVAGKQDFVIVFGVEGFFQLRPHLDELQLIFFFYNVGSHNTCFKMNEKSNPHTPPKGLLFSF